MKKLFIRKRNNNGQIKKIHGSCGHGKNIMRRNNRASRRGKKIHQTNPTPTAALGRTLTMAVLMGTMMKNETDKLTIQILGDGPAGQILAVCNKTEK